MNATKLLPVLALLPLACGSPPPPRPLSEACDQQAVAEFVLECAKAANPHSDEEGEDLVLQCERTALHLFCSTKCLVKPGWDEYGEAYCR